MGMQSIIRERGFSKWYERELLRGHAKLVLVLLCALAALGSVEAFSQPGSQRALMVLSLAVSAAIGAWAVRRYLFLLNRAEFIANQATCPGCQTYGRFGIEAAEGPEEAGVPAALAVRCRRCGDRWRIES